MRYGYSVNHYSKIIPCRDKSSLLFPLPAARTTAEQEPTNMGKLRSADGALLHSGRPSRQERTYTRYIKKTNQVQTVTIKNPRTSISANQKQSANAFSLVISSVSRWIRENRATNSADFQEVKAMFDRQDRYSSIRGFMIAKGMYVVSEDKLSVTVDITARTNFKVAFSIERKDTLDSPV